jgi:hypothetical protein
MATKQPDEETSGPVVRGGVLRLTRSTVEFNVQGLYANYNEPIRSEKRKSIGLR